MDTQTKWEQVHYTEDGSGIPKLETEDELVSRFGIAFEDRMKSWWYNNERYKEFFPNGKSYSRVKREATSAALKQVGRVATKAYASHIKNLSDKGISYDKGNLTLGHKLTLRTAQVCSKLKREYRNSLKATVSAKKVKATQKEPKEIQAETQAAVLKPEDMYRSWADSEDIIPSDKSLGHFGPAHRSTWSRIRSKLVGEGYAINSGPNETWIVETRPASDDNATPKTLDELTKDELLTVLRKLISEE